MINDGFENTIPVIDNKEEIDLYDDAITKKCKIGIRIASEEEPKFEFYTSRLGDPLQRHHQLLQNQDPEKQEVQAQNAALLHQYRYQGHGLLLERTVEMPEHLLRIEAFAPIWTASTSEAAFRSKNSLDFSYDYEYLTEEIIAQIKNICTRNGIDEPHIFTEFGSFTVGESGATLYSIVNQKQQTTARTGT